MSVVLDASAILAFIQDEEGSGQVEAAMADDPRCGAANWSEVAQKVRAAGRDWSLVRALLESYDVRVEPVNVEDAESAAKRWRRGEGLSLADRLGMALADRLGCEIYTADKVWGSTGRVRQIR